MAGSRGTWKRTGLLGIAIVASLGLAACGTASGQTGAAGVSTAAPTTSSAGTATSGSGPAASGSGRSASGSGRSASASGRSASGSGQAAQESTRAMPTPGAKATRPRPPAAPALPATAHPGDHGKGVAALQRQLAALGYEVRKVDGQYGPATEHAVVAFQKVNRISREGARAPQATPPADGRQRPAPRGRPDPPGHLRRQRRRDPADPGRIVGLRPDLPVARQRAPGPHPGGQLPDRPQDRRLAPQLPRPDVPAGVLRRPLRDPRRAERAALPGQPRLHPCHHRVHGHHLRQAGPRQPGARLPHLTARGGCGRRDAERQPSNYSLERPLVECSEDSMPQLEPGAQAPSFSLPDQDGNTVSLDDFKGSKVIVYFYPKDDTPGCTKEACQFNDNLHGFEQAGVPVLGISGDDAASHRTFREKYGLRFPLLSDLDHQVMEAYGAWGEKNSYGKTSVGVLRSTFLVDEQGKVQRSWYNVKADGHAEKVLAEATA